MNEEKISYKDLINGDIPPWMMRFIKGVGKTINTYSMINNGEKIIIGASGGKDSLALTLALALRKKWIKDDYAIEGVMIDWKEHPIEEKGREKIEEFFDALNVPLTVLYESQFPTSFKDDFNCYLCSRNRRRILFSWAEEHNERTIALGHHLDDLVETTLMNMCFRAKFSTMNPVQEFFDGKIRIIRPLIETKENVTKRIRDVYDIPVIKPVCPYDQTNVRARLKPIVKELCHIDKLTREHIYASHDFSSLKNSKPIWNEKKLCDNMEKED